MKKLHVHMSTENLKESIVFYTAMFGTPPTKVRDDYAKWGLDNPSVNFAISLVGAGGTPGIGHLGIETDTLDELSDHIETIQTADAAIKDAHQIKCCYASSDKTWATDPSGVKWENFYSFGESEALQPAPIADTRPKPETRGCC